MDLPRKLWIEKEDQNEQTNEEKKTGLNLYKQWLEKMDNIICINNNNSVKANFLFLYIFFAIGYSFLFTKFNCFLLKKLMFSHSLADKLLLDPLNEQQQKRLNPIWI